MGRGPAGPLDCMRDRTARNSKPQTPGASWVWAVAGALVGGLLCLLAFVPARWAGHAVALASGQQVLLQDVRGSVWNGSAVLVLAGGSGSRDARALPGRLSWQVRPRWTAQLDGLGVGARLQHASCQQTAQLLWQLLPNRFELSGLECQLPAQILAGLGTPWNTLGLEGSAKFSSSLLQWPGRASAGPVRGALELQVLSLSSRLSTLRPLGDYRAVLRGPQAPSAPDLELELATLQGALQLRGQGQQRAGHWRFQGQAQAEPGQDAVLANILNLIGNRSGDIAWRVVRSPLS